MKNTPRAALCVILGIGGGDEGVREGVGMDTGLGGGVVLNKHTPLKSSEWARLGQDYDRALRSWAEKERIC